MNSVGGYGAIGGGSAALTVLMAVVFVACGVAAGYLLRAIVGQVVRPRGRPTAVTEQARSQSRPPAVAPLGDAVRMGVLVDGHITTFDTTTGDAVRAHVIRVLKSAGVEQVPVDLGQPSDPSIHQLVDVATTPDFALDGRIAEIVRPGWRDVNGDVIRSPQVRVWRWVQS